MTRLVRGSLGLAGAATLALTLAGCGSDPVPVRPAPVALSAKVTDLPGTVHVGVLVSLKTAPGEGGAWTSAATGAQVAAYRYQLGKQRVVLDVVNDQGTSDGAVSAVRQLLDKRVSGIVAGTEGSHLTEAMETAARGDTAMLLPYDAVSDEDLPASTWLTGPSAEQVGGAVAALMQQQGWSSPLLVTGGERTLPSVGASTQLTVGPSTAPDAFVKQVKRVVKKEGDDVVVVDLPTETTAKTVAALQSSGLQLPVVLGREAQSPDFGRALTAAGGSLSDQLFSAGADTGDVSALADGSTGRRAAAFLSAVSSADRSDTSGLFDQGSFSSTAGAADIPSHDAVVSIATAAAKAKSGDHTKVLRALSGSTVSYTDGLAGPTLRFRGHPALADSSVVALAATSQSPGARPASAGDTPTLFWFPVPGSTDQ